MADKRNSEYYTNAQARGKSILLRGIRNGKEFRTKVYYQPTLYLPTDKETGCKNIYDQNLKPIKFNDMKEARDFIKDHKSIDNLKIHGQSKFHYTYIAETYPNVEKDWERSHIKTFVIDIEVKSDEGFPEPRDANQPITSISLYDSKADKYIVWGIGEWNKDKSEIDPAILKKTIYRKKDTEFNLLKEFLAYWSGNVPQIVTGWNTGGFDMPYIYNRLTKLGLEVNKLSPWSSARIREYEDRRGTQLTVDISGVDLIDYMELYQKNFKAVASYRLDNIAEIELGQKKIDYSQYGNLFKLYQVNHQKFIDYNIMDVFLVNELDKKLGLLDVAIAVAYKAGTNFSDVQGSVNVWDSMISKELRKENKYVHTQLHPGDAQGIPGGYVKDPQVGKHDWTMSFDLASLYPNLIVQYNLSPETIIDGSKMDVSVDDLLNRKDLNLNSNEIIAGSGWKFRSDKQGILPRLMESLYNERKRYKKVMIQQQQKLAGMKDKRTSEYKQQEKIVAKAHLAQYTRKILLNSGYGCFANAYFRFFDPRIAASITLSGQLSIRTSEKAINTWMNDLLKTEKDYVIAIDTDSNYLNVQPIVDKFLPGKDINTTADALDKLAKDKIEKVIEQGYQNLADYVQAPRQMMSMDREAIANSAVWTAKKRYCMNVVDNEGVRYDTPKVKIQGLEAVKSSTPNVCKDKLFTAIKLILTSSEFEVQKFIAEFKKDFKTLNPNEVAFPRGINGISKFFDKTTLWKKSTPAHVRGALVFNHMIKKLELTNEYQPMKEGEKGKFIYLKMPNKSGSNVISFETELPKELGLHGHIDYDLQFEKAYISAIKIILDAIGWTVEKQNTLEDLFI